MRIAVTGACGFIASNLCNELSRQGYEVYGLDNLYLGVKSNLDKHVYFHDIDITETEFVRIGMEHIEPEIVFHLAAASSSPMFKEQEVWALNTNIMGFVNVMAAARKVGAKRVIYASSSSIYNTNEIPWEEDYNIEPKTFYEASFKAREDIARAYFNQYEFPSIGLRFFSVYGPNERHKGEYANNISQFLWAMQKDERPVIYGDGRQTRDFIYVDDVVRALILAMEPKTNDHIICNVGTGHNTSFNQVLIKLAEGLGKKVEPIYIDNPIGSNYVRDTLAATDWARTYLGFEAKVSLDEGIRRLIGAYQ